MILGTVVGVVQTNVKRMLAYSSIAHAGYLLLGIVAANSAGKAAILFYLLAYAVTNLGALGLVALLGTSQHQHDELRDFSGLWQSRPGLAGLMTVFLLSLGGLPPTAGFIGKWYIFTAAIQEGHYWLAIIGVLTSVVSVFFLEGDVRIRDALIRRHRAELELVAGEGERARAVAVAGVARQFRQYHHAGVELAALLGRFGAALLDLLEDVGQHVAEEDREDRRRCFVGAQPMVVARAGDAGAQQALPLVDRAQDRRAEHEELQVVVRVLARAEQVVSLDRRSSTN